MADARSARQCSNSVAGHACERPAEFALTVDGREMRFCGVCRDLVLAFLDRSSAATIVDVKPLEVASATSASTPAARGSRLNGRIVWLEDDDDLRVAVTQELRAHGCHVVAVSCLAAVHEAVCVEPPDLLLLDRMVPDGDALAYVRRLRADGNRIPVVFLTAHDTLHDLRDGFAHADDYIVKPFSAPDLITRVGRLLRRSASGRPAGQTYTDSLIQMDFETGELQVCGIAVQLARQDFRFLEVLVRNAGAIQSREKLARALWGDEPVATTSLDVVAHRLRRRLKRTALGESAIISVRGRGYLYQAPATPAGQAVQPRDQHGGYGHASQALDILNARERQEKSL